MKAIKGMVEAPIKPTILFVDDNFDRFENFVDSLPESLAEFFWASSTEAAIKTLKSHPHWSVVYLDHDLGKEECGCVLVDWITANKERFEKTTFNIHSWNPPGAEAMFNSLYQAGLRAKVKPFVYTRIKTTYQQPID